MNLFQPVKRKQRDIVGIFTVWSFELIDKAENVFRRKLEKNPTYPFEAVAAGIYEYQTTPHKALWFAVVAFWVSTISALVAYWGQTIDFQLFFYLVAALVSLIAINYYRKMRGYVINTNKNIYEFYMDRELIYRGHLHNFYMRLKGQKTANGEYRYQVVFDGFMVNEIVVTSNTHRHTRIGKLARRLAHRLNLNYFDTLDKSRYHIIRHRCPYQLQYDEQYEP